MKNGSKFIRLFPVALCLCWFTACSGSGKWSGETFVGEGKINDVKPSGASVEKFKLTTEKMANGNRKFVTLDASNHVLGNCKIPVNDTGEGREGMFPLVKNGAVCSSIVDGRPINVTVYAGDITAYVDTTKAEATLSLTGTVQGTSQGYVFEIRGSREN